jgi:hypothetical protein
MAAPRKGVTQAGETEKSLDKLLGDWQFEIFNKFPREEAMQFIYVLKKMEFERGQALSQARQESLRSTELKRRITDLEAMQQNFTADIHGGCRAPRQQRSNTERNLPSQREERCEAKTQEQSSVGFITVVFVLVALMSWYAGSIASGRKCVSFAGVESISSETLATSQRAPPFDVTEKELVREASTGGHGKFYDTKVVEKIMSENQDMRVQLERLWTDVEGAMESGQEMVCWKVK